ncbi:MULTISPECIES: hypothetical protein [unclassified Fibrobacter]|uniref:hypothetical protein n=1 Tax=unclassified Fibrobacter TaxID=2634177 RepID=UPI0009325D21|nr:MULTISPECIES: hypothetical protein [unclassified Fibrobacter]OWV15659.1 hypothetical protein B7992_04570 [Fibrobacter sp. UWH1]
MIYFIASIPFTVVFQIHVSALNKTKNRKFWHFFLQILVGPVFCFSFFGPAFLGACMNDSRIAEGISIYTTSLVFLFNMSRFFYELVRYGKENEKK